MLFFWNVNNSTKIDTFERKTILGRSHITMLHILNYSQIIIANLVNIDMKNYLNVNELLNIFKFCCILTYFLLLYKNLILEKTNFTW